MVIDPFVAGILTTVFSEMLVIFIVALIQIWRKK